MIGDLYAYFTSSMIFHEIERNAKAWDLTLEMTKLALLGVSFMICVNVAYNVNLQF